MSDWSNDISVLIWPNGERVVRSIPRSSKRDSVREKLEAFVAWITAALCSSDKRLPRKRFIVETKLDTRAESSA